MMPGFGFADIFVEDESIAGDNGEVGVTVRITHKLTGKSVTVAGDPNDAYCVADAIRELIRKITN